MIGEVAILAVFDGSVILAKGFAAALPAHAVVDDIVYVPRETPLLLAAAARGLRTVGGLGMLLHQAAPGFARWFGVVPTVTADLRALVEADIAKPSGSAYNRTTERQS